VDLKGELNRMERIEAVLFDWGGVLIDDPAPGLMAYCAEALDVPVEDYRQVHRRHAEPFQRGWITEAAFWQKVCSDLDRPVPSIDSLWGRAFRTVCTPREDVFALVRRLHQENCKTALLSNTESPVVQLSMEPAYDVFDALVFSCTEGALKPERAIYEIAARSVDKATGQCVLIDDRQAFVDGAIKAGMSGILYSDLAQVTKELANLGLPVRDEPHLEARDVLGGR
jgi:putative hydrolase of the HAD superfamily